MNLSPKLVAAWQHLVSARKRPEKGLQYRPNSPKLDENAPRVSWDEHLNLNARCGGGCADLPLQSLIEAIAGLRSSRASQKIVQLGTA